MDNLDKIGYFYVYEFISVRLNFHEVLKFFRFVHVFENSTFMSALGVGSNHIYAHEMFI